MVELVYLWVEDYKNIHQQEFNFSPRFNCTFEDYEDALQYVCVKKADAELIFTNDRGVMSKDIEVKRTDNFRSDGEV